MKVGFRPVEDVRLMVASGEDGTVDDRPFAAVVDALRPGDLVVVNRSATIPAALPVGEGLVLHLSTPVPGGLWVVELRRQCGAGSLPFLDGRAGSTVRLPGGGSAHLLAPFPADTEHPAGTVRLWLAALRLPGTLLDHLTAHGRPIRYGCVDTSYPLSAYQTVFASEPGSAEMPSAGRPFTADVVERLRAAGVALASIVLHTGVSSQEAHEPPYAERYRVPVETADAVNATREAAGRVIAVGTTVTRALETTADDRGRSHPGGGWTELVVTPERGVRVVDGLLTGWHEPEASHLQLLEAVAGRDLLDRSYALAEERGYLWHEFGDVHLLLP